MELSPGEVLPGALLSADHGGAAPVPLLGQPGCPAMGL